MTKIIFQPNILILRIMGRESGSLGFKAVISVVLLLFEFLAWIHWIF